MPQRRKLTTLMVGVILFVSFSAASCGAIVTVEQLEEQIQKEIPIGSHHSSVIAFLDSAKISHSQYLEVKEFNLELDDYVTKRIIGAHVPNVERRFLAVYNIYLRFYFDEAGLLTDYTVKKRRTDP